MAPPRKEGFKEGDRAEGSDRKDRQLDGDTPAPGESGSIGRSGSSGHLDAGRGGRRISAGLTERDDSNGDLLLEHCDGENVDLQWLRALDLLAPGACCVDERLKPLLKLNVSSGVAEERLMEWLNQIGLCHQGFPPLKLLKIYLPREPGAAEASC